MTHEELEVYMVALDTFAMSCMTGRNELIEQAEKALAELVESHLERHKAEAARYRAALEAIIEVTTFSYAADKKPSMPQIHGIARRALEGGKE